MSNKHVVKLASVIGLGFIAGFTSMRYWQSKKSYSSQFASVESSKAQLFLGKHHMLTSVKITTVDRAPASSSDLVELEGYVTLNSEIDRPLFWEWTLPEGVELVTGNLRGYETGPLAGRTYKTTIVVSGFTPETRKLIALQGYVDYETSRSGNSATISSNPESSFEYIAPALKAEVDLDKMQAGEKVNSEKITQ